MHKIFLLMLLLWCVPVRAADWYVDAAATGAGNGTSWSNAWTNTLSIGWSSVNPGDTVWFRAGNYSHLTISNEDGITIKVDPAATGPAVFAGVVPSQIFSSDDVVYDGLVGGNRLLKFVGPTVPTSASGPSEVLRLASSRRVIIRGIEVNRQAMWLEDLKPTNGIEINNSSKPANEDVLIDNCWIGYISGDAVNINKGGPTDGWGEYVIQNTTVFNIGDDGVTTPGNTTIRNNIINTNGQAAMFEDHPDGVQVLRGATYVDVDSNLFLGFTQNIFVERALAHIKITNNITVNGLIVNSNKGMTLSVMDPEVPITGITYIPFEGNFIVANNVIYNTLTAHGINGGGSIARLVPEPQRMFRNNIFVNCKWGVQSGSAELLDSTNMWFDLPGVQYYNKFGSPVSITSLGDRLVGAAINANPRLNDPAGGDFTLQAGSPAIGSGANLSAYFSNDRAGATRPATGAWDAGAYIYDSGSAPSDTTPPTFVSAAFSSTGDSVTMVFSEAVQGIDLSHYTIAGHTLSGLTGSGTTWTFTVSPIRQAGAGTSMAYTGGTGRTRDVSGNLLASGTFSVTNGSLATPPQPGRRGGAKRLLRR